MVARQTNMEAIGAIGLRYCRRQQRRIERCGIGETFRCLCENDGGRYKFRAP